MVRGERSEDAEGNQSPGSIRGGGGEKTQTTAKQTAQKQKGELLEIKTVHNFSHCLVPPLSGVCVDRLLWKYRHVENLHVLPSAHVLLSCAPVCQERTQVKEKEGLKAWVDCWSCIRPL